MSGRTRVTTSPAARALDRPTNVRWRICVLIALASFLVFILGGSLGLWAALTHKNPSGALTLAAGLLPFFTFWAITDFLASNAVVGSKSEATRLIRGGGVSINGDLISDEKARLRPEDAIYGRYFVIRKGKRDNFLVRVLP